VIPESKTISMIMNSLDSFSQETPLDKKKADLLEKKTISKTYLTKFESLREFVTSGESCDGITADEANKEMPVLKKTSLFVTDTVKINASSDRKKIFLFKLNMMERVFLTMHRPASSIFSKWLSNFMMAVIVISCVFFVISSDPDVKSVPSSCDKPACNNDPDLCPGEQLCEPVEVTNYLV
jgi:hypothetical protein